MIGNIPQLTPEEAAQLLKHNDIVGFSGFTPAGAAKVIPRAIAQRARSEHSAGRPFKIGVVTGASTGQSLDGTLARAHAVSFRTPYQSDPTLRNLINQGEVRFVDMHLSNVSQVVRSGLLGSLKFAIIEACYLTPDGEICLTTSVGITPTLCQQAEHILVEINGRHSSDLCGLHDLYELENFPHRREIPIYRCSDRIGTRTIQVAPQKIVGYLETCLEDESVPFRSIDETTLKIGEHVADFLVQETRRGTIPTTFLPVQSGVGNIANSVLGALGEHPDIPAFEMYTEVLQDSSIQLMRAGKVAFASSTALTLSSEVEEAFYRDIDFFRDRVVLRPQEISNSPEVIRRLGIISINTALEVDLFGNVNSTHVMGQRLLNGIGGSGDFTRNAFLSIFTCPSTTKGGTISTIVPLASHVDHNEHSVQVVVTEYGVADLRCKTPEERARLIVDHCAHPDFREELHGYFNHTKSGHVPQTLRAAFAMHQKYLESGDMHGVDWSQL